MTKLPSNVGHNRPATIFLCTGPSSQTAQKQKSCTTKSPLMQDWGFIEALIVPNLSLKIDGQTLECRGGYFFVNECKFCRIQAADVTSKHINILRFSTTMYMLLEMLDVCMDKTTI